MHKRQDNFDTIFKFCALLLQQLSVQSCLLLFSCCRSKKIAVSPAYSDIGMDMGLVWIAGS